MALKDHILKLADGVSKCQENAKSLAQVIFRGLDDIADNLPDSPGGGSTVEVTQVLSSGTKIATISVDDTPTDLYAPTPTEPTDVDVTQVVSTGTKIATITVDSVPTDLYAPTPTVPLHQYSTTEQIVGKWIDNGDIYEKTAFIEDISISANSNTDINISDYFTNVDKVLAFECFRTDGVLPDIMPTSSLNPYSIGISFDVPNNHIIFTRGSGGNATISVYMTLKYTKTS